MKPVPFSAVMTALMIVVCSAVPGFAATKFGMVFEISGKAEIINPLGKNTHLERGKHILLAVKVGDRIKTFENSRVVVVSLNSKTGYEIVPNSEARVENSAITAIRGEVKASSGYIVPSGQNTGPIGAIVLRGHDNGQCITPLTPTNSSIITLTPVLSWAVACKDIKSATVRIIEDRKVLFETPAIGTFVKVPAGVLKYGRTYAWIVDAGQTTAGAESEFSIPTEATVKAIEEKIAAQIQTEKDLTKRLSHLFFLANNDLKDSAREELERLQKEFPENDYLKEL
jgi:hypothetical protein